MYAEYFHHDKLILCVNNIRKWLLNNNLLINIFITTIVYYSKTIV